VIKKDQEVGRKFNKQPQLKLNVVSDSQQPTFLGIQLQTEAFCIYAAMLEGRQRPTENIREFNMLVKPKQNQLCKQGWAWQPKTCQHTSKQAENTCPRQHPTDLFA